MCAAKYSTGDKEAILNQQSNNSQTETKTNSTSSPFDTIYKLFKKHESPTNLPELLDFNNLSLTMTRYKVELCPIKVAKGDNTHQTLGLIHPNEWNCYTLPENCPGLIFIPNIFKEGLQFPWVWRAVSNYHQLPNKTNIDSHYNRNPKESIWNPSEWICYHGNQLQMKQNFKDNLFYQLRWATVGYQYDWTAKKYTKNDFNEIPTDLAKLFTYIADVLGYGGFKLEAGIINYYHLDSTLGGHIDQAEYNMIAPLFSLSFGQSAIFLMGGTTKEVEPLPILLRSGDLVVMTGTSRTSYHGVPRVIAGSNTHLWGVTDISSLYQLIPELNNVDMLRDKEAILNYIACSRINMNMREVGSFPAKDLKKEN